MPPRPYHTITGSKHIGHLGLYHNIAICYHPTETVTVSLIGYSILPLNHSSITMVDLVHDKTCISSGLKLIYHYFSYKNITLSDMAVNTAFRKPTHGGAGRSAVDRKGKSLLRLSAIPKRTYDCFLQNGRGQM